MVPTFGSMVQKGKLAACAFAFDKQLNKVDLPTLGNPTIPHFSDIIIVLRARKYDIPLFHIQSTSQKHGYLANTFAPLIAFP
jgi:hypothetical protein